MTAGQNAEPPTPNFAWERICAITDIKEAFVNNDSQTALGHDLQLGFLAVLCGPMVPQPGTPRSPLVKLTLADIQAADGSRQRLVASAQEGGQHMKYLYDPDAPRDALSPQDYVWDGYVRYWLPKTRFSHQMAETAMQSICVAPASFGITF